MAGSRSLTSRAARLTAAHLRGWRPAEWPARASAAHSRLSADREAPDEGSRRRTATDTNCGDRRLARTTGRSVVRRALVSEQSPEPALGAVSPGDCAEAGADSRLCGGCVRRGRGRLPVSRPIAAAGGAPVYICRVGAAAALTPQNDNQLMSSGDCQLAAAGRTLLPREPPPRDEIIGGARACRAGERQ